MRLHDVSKGTSSDDTPVLTEQQLNDIQRVSLMMLDDINEICQKYGLRLYIIGGTAIGALRHKGFIPWDDDIDIAMTRKDYLKLASAIREERSDKYTVSDARDKENYGRLIPKVRLRGTTYRTVLEKDLDDCGVRIDIFLIENTYDSKFMRTLHGGMCMFFGFALSCRRLWMHYDEFSKLSGGLSFKVKSLIGMFCSFASIERWAKWTDWWYSCCRKENSVYVTLPSDGKHFFGELEKRKKLLNGRKVVYEGRELFVPGNTDHYLRKHYGDYMKIPPKEKQLRSKYLEFDLGIYGTGE